MLHYYCIPSCDKCRKARKLLQMKQIEHSEIDMRKDGLDETLIQSWIDRVGLDGILNTKSATWRNLDPDLREKIQSHPAQIINTNAAMLHRPILDFGDQMLLGKDALNWLETV